MPGAYDLASLKRDGESTIDQVLFQLGLKCVCGQEVTSDGIELTAVFIGTVSTPDGGQSAGAQVARTTFCSRDCAKLLEFLGGLPKDESVRVAVKPAPTEWLRSGTTEETGSVENGGGEGSEGF